MRIGYIRALPNDQSFVLQQDSLRRSSCSQFYEELASSKCQRARQRDRSGRPVSKHYIDESRIGQGARDVFLALAEVEGNLMKECAWA